MLNFVDLPPEGEGARRAEGGCSIISDDRVAHRIRSEHPLPALRATFPLRGKDHFGHSHAAPRTPLLSPCLGGSSLVRTWAGSLKM